MSCYDGNAYNAIYACMDEASLTAVIYYFNEISDMAKMVLLHLLFTKPTHLYTFR